MSAPDATEPVRAGSLLCGRYQVIRMIAQGGMAAVWEAHDQVLARSVAVKVLHPHLAQDRSFQERFRREAISAARLAHPNVVATFDAGITSDGTAFIVMELIRGRTLSAFMTDHKPLPVFVVIQITMQIADALAHAHGAGLVHRDIKPANVLVCDVQSRGVPLVKVTDFGIAKAAAGIGLDLTLTGTILGTPRYLSPEQIEGREPDARADLYALGVVLFEMLTGNPPFRGPTELAVAVQHINAVPPRLGDLRPGVPPALDRLAAALLAKRPDDRPPSAVAVRRALDGIDAGETESLFWRPASSPPAPSPPAPSPPARGGSAAGPGSLRAGISGNGSGPGAGSVPPGVGSGSGRDRGMAPSPAMAPTGHGGGGANPARFPTRVAPGVRPGPAASPMPAQTRVAGPAPPPPPSRGGGQGPSRDQRRKRRPNWTGRLVAALVLAAILVVIIVVSINSSNGGSHSPANSSGSSASGSPIAIQDVSVFHLERDADHAAIVARTFDQDPTTAWMTDSYHGPHFANLRHGLGLAITLPDSQKLSSLTVTSPTSGWSAEVYVADAVPSPAALAPWGLPVSAKEGIGGSATFNLSGHRGRAVLLWLTDLGPTNQAVVDELTVR